MDYNPQTHWGVLAMPPQARTKTLVVCTSESDAIAYTSRTGVGTIIPPSGPVEIVTNVHT